jgi:3-methylfumaryl-CoA hydratase
VFARAIVPDDVLLFRYSALTFNGHRIHYDRRYVTAVEGLSGVDRARPADRDLAARPAAPRAPCRRASCASTFKAVSPLFDLHPFEVCGRSDGERRFALWARNHEGGLAMQASAEVA